MARIEYAPKGEDGWTVWMRPEERKHTMVCCDCGLAHDLEFRIKRSEFRMRRNERSTGQVRRHMKGKE